MKKLSKIDKRPWGEFHDMAEESGKWHLKVIIVKQGQRLSLQNHKLRSEFWIITEGEARVQKGDLSFELKAGDTILFEKEEPHRLEGITDAVIVEVSFGKHNEDDIIRLADDYGR